MKCWSVGRTRVESFEDNGKWESGMRRGQVAAKRTSGVEGGLGQEKGWEWYVVWVRREEVKKKGETGNRIEKR